jgi:Chaperone of endosialidase
LIWGGDGTGYALSFASQDNAGVLHSPVMTLLDSGNVGIGTNVPGSKLNVSGVIQTDSGALALNTYYSGGWVYGTGAVAGLISVGGAGDMYLSAAPSGTVGSPCSIGAAIAISYTGGLTIGKDWCGINTPPANGLLVEGNVGIGTPTPGFRLHLKGPAPNSFPFVISNSANTNTGLAVLEGAVGDYVLMICDVAGQQRVQLSSSSDSWLNGGNVGIGTAAPANKLHVVSNDANFTVDTPLVNQTASIGFCDGGQPRWAIYTVAGVNHELGIYSSSIATNVITFQQGGNVGIGTTAPAAKFDVQLLAGEHAGFINYSSHATVAAWNDGLTAWGKLHISPAQDAYLCETAGNVGIGTTTPAAKLEVIGPSTTTWAAVFTNPHAAIGDATIQVRCGLVGADTTSQLMTFYNATASAAQGAIARNGSAAVIYATTSDERLKDDICESARGLETLMRLNVSEYVITGDQRRQQGLMAQDLHQVYPEAVYEGGDDPAIKPWMIDYGRLTPLIIRAMQQQQARIETLENMVMKGSA